MKAGGGEGVGMGGASRVKVGGTDSEVRSHAMQGFG